VTTRPSSISLRLVIAASRLPSLAGGALRRTFGFAVAGGVRVDFAQAVAKSAFALRVEGQHAHCLRGSQGELVRFTALLVPAATAPQFALF
jgi:hypothetical protein